jgi:hypothetical protein
MLNFSRKKKYEDCGEKSNVENSNNDALMTFLSLKY